MEEVTINLPGSRIADDDIYIHEDRRAQPKEYFKDSLNFINARTCPHGATWLDIGCATGEYIDFAKNQLSHYNFIGLDISEKMINKAAKQDPKSQYITGDVRNASTLPEHSANIITIFGVIDCFDEIHSTFNSLMKWIKPGGLILIFDVINTLPIDTIMRHRRASVPHSPWETGWNLHSRQTFENELKKYDQIQSVDFTPFEIPIDIPQRADDPMRTWTIKTEQKERQLVNGAAQLVNLHFISIKVK